MRRGSECAAMCVHEAVDLCVCVSAEYVDGGRPGKCTCIHHLAHLLLLHIYAACAYSDVHTSARACVCFHLWLFDIIRLLL